MCYKRGLLKGDAYYFHLEEQTELFSLDSFFQMSFQYLYIFPILPAIIHCCSKKSWTRAYALFTHWWFRSALVSKAIRGSSYLVSFCGLRERQGETGRVQQTCRIKSPHAGTKKATFPLNLLGRQRSGPAEVRTWSTFKRRWAWGQCSMAGGEASFEYSTVGTPVISRHSF